MAAAGQDGQLGIGQFASQANAFLAGDEVVGVTGNDERWLGELVKSVAEIKLGGNGRKFPQRFVPIVYPRANGGLLFLYGR